jgi:hypothetical protein
MIRRFFVIGLIAFSLAELTCGPALAMPGDYNNNGAVDAADYVVWRENLNSTNYIPMTQHPIG